MRIAVFAGVYVPKKVIYMELDRLHETNLLHVLATAENQGSLAAAEWARSRLGSTVNVIESVRASDKRHMGRLWDVRANIIAICKVHQPERILVFGQPTYLAHGVGKIIVQNAEKWDIPLFLAEPPGYTDAQPVERCGKKQRVGRAVCSRFKGHPGHWHWSLHFGERRSKFWAI